MEDRTQHELTVEEKKWAAQQVALVVGATEEDSLPLAEFLIGIDNPNELQSQLLDMLGESPLALTFCSDLISKRFPPARQVPAPPLPPRDAPQQKESLPQHSSANTSRPQSRLSTHGTPSEPPPVEQRSIRQLKKERQQLLKKQKEEEKKRQERAKRKRVRCECQASEHPLLTNCLTCGRIICDSEGPGPCMFCGSEVESPDQQLQQHMRRLLRHAEQNEDATSNKQKDKGKGKAPPTPQRPPVKGMLYSMKAGGGMSTREAGLLWDNAIDAEETPSSDNGDSSPKALVSRGKELSEEEYLLLAFKCLGIDSQTTDPTALQEAEAWVKATRRKERLLDYDRTAAQRTKLIDELSDFDPFSVGKWMSPEEKIEAEKRKVERAKEEQKREERLRSGMRVLRLDFQKGAVDIKRPDEADDEEYTHPEMPGSSTNSASNKKPQPVVDPSGKSESTSSETVDAYPKHATATQSSATHGSFANNPLLGDRAAPKFILEPEKKSSTKVGKKTKSKAKGKEPEPGKERAAAGANDLEKRRQMLRIQTDADDEKFA
ncbi:hypothetical protein EV175_002973 [Coemansia sp. RSA 1933]|nr:hypothetical protein EV175_002973 [Coemansia sp. RSA 1933]